MYAETKNSFEEAKELTDNDTAAAILVLADHIGHMHTMDFSENVFHGFNRALVAAMDATNLGISATVHLDN